MLVQQVCRSVAVALAATFCLVAGASAQVPGSSADFQASVPDTVYFEFNRADLTPEARAILDQQAAWLLANMQTTVDIQGHTDAVGSNAYNDALGLRRANAVEAYLIAAGVADDRMNSVLSYGESQLVVVTPTAERANRRATTVVTSDDLLAAFPTAGQCFVPTPGPLASLSGGELSNELTQRVERTTAVQQEILANWTEGRTAEHNFAVLAKTDCSVALGFARGGNVDQRYNNECDCWYGNMLALQGGM